MYRVPLISDDARMRVVRRNADDVEAIVGVLDGHRFGGVNPSAEQLRELITADRSGPLQFVNLLVYHDVARDPAGHELAGSGFSGGGAKRPFGGGAPGHRARRGRGPGAFKQG